MANKKEKNEIKINEEESSLAEFTRRGVPNDSEVKKFDEVVEKEFAKNNNDEEKFDTEVETEQDERMDESLNEIYDDGKGGKVDVQRLDKVRRHGFIFKSIIFLLTVAVLVAAGYSGYYFYKHLGSDVTALSFNVQAKTEVVSGEEFFYTIEYHNDSNINFQNAKIEVNFPDNFIFLDSQPATSSEQNNAWQIGDIKAHAGGMVKIKGMLTGPEQQNNVLIADISYNPAGVSSIFKKEASLTTIIKSIGMNVNFDFVQSSLVNEVNEIKITFNRQDQNFINNFRISLAPQANITILNNQKVTDDNLASSTVIRPGVWQINSISDTPQVLPIFFKFTNKISPSQDVTIDLEQPSRADSFSQFLEKKITYEVMKNDLNLTLIVNGSRNDQGIDFAQTLNYSIVYKNKGETDMKDVVIMAALNSNFLDWTTLKDDNKGRENGSTIIWTKNEIPALATVGQNQEGTIDFSINLMDVGKVNLNNSNDFQVQSYAQFSVGDQSSTNNNASSTDNRSNTITNKINSDLKLDEQLRYFDQDNITVGNGQLPLQVGQKTSLKVYWTLTNNMHDLSDAKVTATLPSYVSWDDKNRTNVGTIQYDAASNSVTWNIGRLPVSVFRADAEFNVGVVPVESDRGKIMVIVPGAEVTATDSVTGTALDKKTGAKTSKLEDDDIAQKTNDWIVR
jgi:hypothetical protein